MNKYLLVVFLLVGLGACKTSSGPNDSNVPQYVKVKVRSMTASLYSVRLPGYGDSDVSRAPCNNAPLIDTSSFCNGINSGVFFVDQIHQLISGQFSSYYADGQIPIFGDELSDQLLCKNVPYSVLHDSILLVDVQPTKDLVLSAEHHHVHYAPTGRPHEYNITHEDYSANGVFDTSARLRMTFVLIK